jgi:vacuolar-type H+-ATPase subunit E/Vma4
VIFVPQEEKISKFVQAITREAQERRAEVTRETDEFLANELKKAEEEALSESFAFIQRRAAVIREDIGRALSKNLQDERRKLVSRRDEIVDEVFAKAQKRLLEFAASPDYKAFLLDSVKSAGESLGKLGALYAGERDSAYKDELSKAAGAPVYLNDEICLGGLRFENLEKTLLADDTLEARLEAQRGWFLENCGMTFN